MKKRTKNIKASGFNPEIQKAHRAPEDWKFGAISQPGVYSVPIEERIKHLPMGEVQRTSADDMMDCASRAPVNKLECDFTYAYQKGLIKAENRIFLESHGYVKDGRIVFADAFVAINSGTTRDGNSLKAPLEAIRKKGLVPKSMLPLLPNMTFEQYHDPKRITDTISKLGAEFADRFIINYEEVQSVHFKEANKDDMLVVACFAWPEPRGGVYYRVEYDINHAIMQIVPQFDIFDNYEEASGDFIKRLSADYKFWEQGYRIYVSKENGAADIKEQLGIIAQLLRWIADFISSLAEKNREVTLPAPVPLPEPKPQPPVPARKIAVDRFCEAIQAYEGWFPPGSVGYPKGSISYRNNNPGNIKGLDGKFLVFKTYAEGFTYLLNYVTRVKTNQHSAYPKDCSILQFFRVYAPTADSNSPQTYANFVATKIGVTTDFLVKDLI